MSEIINGEVVCSDENNVGETLGEDAATVNGNVVGEVLSETGETLVDTPVTIPDELKTVPLENTDYQTESVGVEKCKAYYDEAADIFIKSIVPYKLIFEKNNSGREVALLIYLCTDDNDELFIIYSKTYIKDEEHKEFLSLIPFAEDEDIDFINQKACMNLIMASLPSYTCDMNFTLTYEESKSEDPVLTTDITNLKTGEKIKAAINSNNFTAVAFINNYLKEMITNEHDLSLATVAGFKSKNDIKAEFFNVHLIEVLAMAPAEVEYPDESFIDKLGSLFGKKNKVKYSDSLAVVARFSRPKSGDVESYTVLIPFNVGVEFDEEKFKGETVENIENTYYSDGDQYVSTLYIDDCHIYGIDKAFTVIRAKSKNGDIKIFLLDTYANKSLKEKINEY